MRTIFVFLITIMSLAACKNSDKQAGTGNPAKDSAIAAEKQRIMADSANYTTIEWLDPTVQDLGKVKEGKKVDVAFHFRNTGTKPLVVADATASCGCTTPEKPAEPVAPGAEGVIKATFDSKGRKGTNNKHIFVDANTKPAHGHQLEFKVEVE